MNLILLFEEDFISPHRVHLTGRRFLHIKDILKVHAGRELVVGKVNGLIGQGKVLNLSKDSLRMEVKLKQKAPPPLNLTLIMALPRPNVLKRTLLCAASLGIKKIYILNFFRVDKSLWNSNALEEGVIEEQLVLGLEQAKDTLMPQVFLQKWFKPFVQDKLPSMIKGTVALAAHPGVREPCPYALKKKVTLVIGPEGGMIDYEIQQLIKGGFQIVDLGPRILRFESVLPYMIGRIRP
ncbi:MAG: 16S rRNA (uracil(1498)-N(3))-methyltransferase [Candidatus Omnitrophica bacterium]|nr:16S rRNA (uracil(1498)-N(3))-methyltransferase [Candidatus Omnitrophota bacterium]